MTVKRLVRVRWILSLIVLLCAFCIVLPGCGQTPSSNFKPVSKSGSALTVKGTQYIARDRIIFPPPQSQPSEVRYPNGEVRKGAFVRPPGGVSAPAPTSGYERHITQPGLTLIRDEEGFESCPYWDPYGGVWTIGIGEAYVSSSTPCESEYTAYLKLDSQVGRNYEWSIRAIGGDGFDQNIFNALVDFDYNEGPYIFEINSGLSYHLSHHEFYSAEQEILGFDIAGGAYNGDLARRREREVEMMRRPEPHVETAAQRHVREKRELAGHEQVLAQLRVRQRVLRRELAAKGCYPRLKANRAGPTCRRWKVEGNTVSAHGKVEDAAIKKLEVALR